MRIHELYSRGSLAFSTGGALMMRRRRQRAKRPTGRVHPLRGEKKKKASKNTKKEIASIIKHYTRNNRKISSPDALQVVVRGKPKQNFHKRKSVQDFVERNVSPPKSTRKRQKLKAVISDVVKGRHNHGEIVEKLSRRGEKRERDADDPLRRYKDPRGESAKRKRTSIGMGMARLNGPEKVLDEPHWDKEENPRGPVKPRSPTKFTPPSTPKPTPKLQTPKKALGPILSSEPSDPVNTEMQSFLTDQKRLNEQFQRSQDTQRAEVDQGMTFTSPENVGDFAPQQDPMKELLADQHRLNEQFQRTQDEQRAEVDRGMTFASPEDVGDFSEHPSDAFMTPLPDSPKATPTVDSPKLFIPEEKADVPMSVLSPKVASPKLQVTQNEPISIDSAPPAQFTFNPTQTETEAQKLERFRQLAGYSG
jgi:hypothetical protein